MRVILLLAAVLILFAIAGWITFGRDSGRASINLETEKVRQDTSEIMHKGSEALEKTREKVAPHDTQERVAEPARP